MFLYVFVEADSSDAEDIRSLHRRELKAVFHGFERRLQYFIVFILVIDSSSYVINVDVIVSLDQSGHHGSQVNGDVDLFFLMFDPSDIDEL